MKTLPKMAKKDGLTDAGLVASAQAIGHDAIARYGTLIAWADQPKPAEAAALREQNLAEKKAAGEMLTSIAESANPSTERAEAT